MDQFKMKALSKLLSDGGQSYPYQTTLTPDQEAAFQQWLQANKVPNDDSPTNDYDMRGFYQALVNQDPKAIQGISPIDNQMHFTDFFKTPYHQSLSNESQYAPTNAPHWEGTKLVNPKGDTVHLDLPESDEEENDQ